MIRKIKLWYYKRRLKQAYLKYLDDSYDCGGSLSEYLTGSKSLVNFYIDKVNSIDPEAKMNYLR